MTTILLAMGDAPQALSQNEIESMFAIAEAIGSELAARTYNVIHGGRAGTLAVAVLKTLQKGVAPNQFSSRVFTYLPKIGPQSEIPEDDLAIFGRAMEVAPWVEERRERMVADADIVVLMGVGRGITAIKKLAHLKSRAIIPIPIGTPELREEHERFLQETNHDPNVREHVLTISSFNIEPAQVANSAVSLIDLVATKKLHRHKVFLAMPFVNEFSYRDDAEDALATVCRNKFQLEVHIVRDTDGREPIITEILSNIERCKLFVAYLDLNRPNVYLEAGYARGLGKPVILACHSDSNPAFDARAFEIIFWKTIRELSSKLEERIAQLMQKRVVV